MTSTVAERYAALVARGAISPDGAQESAVRRLDALAVMLREHVTTQKSGALGWLFAKKNAIGPAVKGLYVWGDVGRGKTMLMDLFFEALPIERKRRVHFHAFMQDVHGRIGEARKATSSGDPIGPVANAIAAETKVLCFDEFAVTDIADAMILGRLFTKLFEHGVVVVATSNVEPGNLYKDGLQRQNFLPFLSLLAQRVDVVHLTARTDFRMEKLDERPVWHVPTGEAADAALDAIWARVTGGTEEATHLIVNGRRLEVPRAGVAAARFTFAQLCEQPLGAADYLALAARFDTIVLDRIPVMAEANRNEAKRFINLIDTLYDQGVKLVASAASEPAGLYTAETGKEAFEFRRTISRLIEMRSREYLALPHRTIAAGSFVAVET